MYRKLEKYKNSILHLYKAMYLFKLKTKRKNE